MENRIIIFGNIVLVWIALFLGYFIYQQQRAPDSLPQEVLPHDITLSPGSLSGSAYTEESDALNWPLESASNEEKQKHVDLIQRFGKKADYVDIAKCVGYPVVYQSGMGETITLRNQDTLEHTILLGKSLYAVPAGSTAEVAVDNETFEFGPGNYGYVCDSREGVAGVILVTL